MSDFKITKNENQKDPVVSHMLFTKALHGVFSCFIAAGYVNCYLAQYYCH